MGLAPLRGSRVASAVLVLISVTAIGLDAGHAGQVTILGDSIGVGLSMASGMPSRAHNSVAIRSADAVRQLGHVPANSTAVVSLGTNDAVGNIRGVEPGIDRLLDVADRADVKLVWLGPPCVRKRWNVAVQKLDDILRARLSGRAIYVSAADDRVCDRTLRAADGVHFTMRGYALLWSRAAGAMGASAAASTAGIVAGGTPRDAAGPSSTAFRLRPALPTDAPGELAQSGAEPAPSSQQN